MADIILLQLMDMAGQQASWHPMGKSPALIAPKGEGTLKQAADALHGWRILVVAPAEEMLLTHVAIPTKNQQRLIQAIPFTLENELAEDLDQLHFVSGERGKNGNTPVVVIARDRLSDWLVQLKAVGLQTYGLYPDLLGLPLTAGHWSLFLHPGRVLVRTGIDSGFCIDPENLRELLTLAYDQADTPPEQLDLYQSSGFDMPGDLLDYLEQQLCPVQQHKSLGGLAPLLADNLHEKQAINLLQGQFKQIDKRAVQWRRWLPAAVVFGLLVCLSIVSSIVDYVRYGDDLTRLTAEIEQTFRQALPETKRVIDPKAQMEQYLRQLRSGQAAGGADFLGIIALPAAVIATRKESQLENISYRDGQLDLKITLKELPALEEIKKQIEAGHYTVEIRSANVSGDQVSAHLRITGGGA